MEQKHIDQAAILVHQAKHALEELTRIMATEAKEPKPPMRRRLKQERKDYYSAKLDSRVKARKPKL